MRLKSWQSVVFLLALASWVIPAAAEPSAPGSDPAKPLRDELPLGELVVGLSTDRSVYSPHEPVLVEVGIGNPSDHEVTFNSVVVVVAGTRGPMPSPGVRWLPGQVRVLDRRGRQMWASTAYIPKERTVKERSLPAGSFVWYKFLWPQFRSADTPPGPGDYAVEAQFLISGKGWEGNFPTLSLPVTVSDQPLHPQFETEKEGLVWRVDLDRAQPQPGQAIRIKLTVANVGKEPVSMWWPEQFLDSYFVISDSRGKEVWTNRVKEEKKGFESLWPTLVTFPPGECRLVVLGEWDGKTEVAGEGSEETKRVDAPPGEYVVKTVRGFPSMPIFDDLKFCVVAP